MSCKYLGIRAQVQNLTYLGAVGEAANVNVYMQVYRWNKTGKMLIIIEVCDQYVGFVRLYSSLLNIFEMFHNKKHKKWLISLVLYYLYKVSDPSHIYWLQTSYHNPKQKNYSFHLWIDSKI